MQMEAQLLKEIKELAASGEEDINEQMIKQYEDELLG